MPGEASESPRLFVVSARKFRAVAMTANTQRSIRWPQSHDRYPPTQSMDEFRTVNSEPDTNSLSAAGGQLSSQPMSTTFGHLAHESALPSDSGLVTVNLVTPVGDPGRDQIIPHTARYHAVLGSLNTGSLVRCGSAHSIE